MAPRLPLRADERRNVQVDASPSAIALRIPFSPKGSLLALSLPMSLDVFKKTLLI